MQTTVVNAAEEQARSSMLIYNRNLMSFVTSKVDRCKVNVQCISHRSCYHRPCDTLQLDQIYLASFLGGFAALTEPLSSYNTLQPPQR